MLPLVAVLFAQEQSKTPEPAKPAAESKPTLNLLGQTNTLAGESRRNENIQFNLIDNNALKDLNLRMGTTATIVTEFSPSRQYFGVEFGNQPPALLHVASIKPALFLHGEIFFTHNNSVFNARRFFQAGPVLPARENNYGFQFSLPLWKKAFLSLDGSQQKIRGSINGNVLVPLPSEHTLLTTDAGSRSLLQRFLSAYPLTPPNRTDIDPRALNTNSPQHVDTDRFSTRLDQAASNRDRITARYALVNQNVKAFQFVAGQNPDTAIKSHQARLTWQRTWSKKTVGEFSAGLDRTHTLLTPEPHAVGPQVQIGTAWTTLGPGSNVPLDRIQDFFRYAASLSRTEGKHKLTAGVEAVRLRFNGREASSNRGNWYFRNDFGRDAITNFLMGVPSRYSTGIGELARGFRKWDQAWFAGDTWQAASNLTVNLGLRWQPGVAPHEVNGLTTIPFSCDCNNLAPRAGFAYRPPGNRGLVRGAFGLQYGDLYPVTFQQLRWNQPRFQKIEVQAPFFLQPLRGADIGPAGRATLFQVPSNLRSPYSYQYNLSWETEFHANWRVQLGYVGSRTHKLPLLNHYNRAVAVPGIPFNTNTLTERRPDARYFEVRRVENSSRAYFDAARATLVVPQWRGFAIDASYWFGKALDTGAAYTNTAAGDDALQGYSQSQNLIQKDLKGLSAFDQSHAALLRVRWQMPKWNALGGWALSAIALSKTGMPFTVFSGSDAPGFGNSDGTNGDRPDIVDAAILGRTIGNPDTAALAMPRAAFRFLQPGADRGNIGMGTFRRAGIANVNTSLARTWKLSGDRAVTFRAESVNFFNTPQFAAPNADLSSPSFSKITNTLNDGRTFSFTLQFRF